MDRLIAIWQILHEESWFDGSDIRDEDQGTFAIDRLHHDKPQDPLRPFHKNASGDYWTSADAREVTSLGYTYPELEKWNHTTADGSYDRARHISVLVNRLNHDYNSAWAAAEKAELTADPGQGDGMKLASMATLITVAKQDPIDLEIDDYVVNVIYEKYIAPSLTSDGITMLIVIGLLSTEPHSRSTSL